MFLCVRLRAHVYFGRTFVVDKKVQPKKAVDDVFECYCNVLLCQQIICCCGGQIANDMLIPLIAYYAILLYWNESLTFVTVLPSQQYICHLKKYY